jgi:hypothetical protein
MIDRDVADRRMRSDAARIIAAERFFRRDARSGHQASVAIMRRHIGTTSAARARQPPPGIATPVTVSRS